MRYRRRRRHARVPRGSIINTARLSSRREEGQLLVLIARRGHGRSPVDAVLSETTGVCTDGPGFVEVEDHIAVVASVLVRGCAVQKVRSWGAFGYRQVGDVAAERQLTVGDGHGADLLAEDLVGQVCGWSDWVGAISNPEALSLRNKARGNCLACVVKLTRSTMVESGDSSPRHANILFKDGMKSEQASMCRYAE